MIKLANEYVDIKNIKHNVEHIILPEKDNISKDRILEEILLALVRKPKKVTDLV
ncbi:MAG: hypothetical protein ACI4RH_11130 [Huintestinicola sp.]